MKFSDDLEFRRLIKRTKPTTQEVKEAAFRLDVEGENPETCQKLFEAAQRACDSFAELAKCTVTLIEAEGRDATPLREMLQIDRAVKRHIRRTQRKRKAVGGR
jgi:Skp family chaperone for outer membrane proteins